MTSRVLITGAGTLGTELAKQLLDKGYMVRVMDNSEQALWKFEERVAKPDSSRLLEMVLGDINDHNTVVRCMRRMEFVIHTAALKHVRFTNDSPVECIETNILGTKDLILDAMRRDSVRKFIFISTDKACFPINIYGESKRVGEYLAAWAYEQSGKNFMSCRFGNYLGSSGSVIDRWKEQRASGEILLTDPNMRRFFIKPAEVAAFVIRLMESSDESIGKGNIYIPIMKVIDMETLSSVVAKKWGVKVRVIGKFPGEKADEVLLNQEEMSRARIVNDILEVRKEAGTMQQMMLTSQVLPQMTTEEVEEYVKDVI